MEGQKNSSVEDLFKSSRLSGAFRGIGRFMQARGLTNVKAVKSALSKVPTYSLFRSARKKFRRLPIRINFVGWQYVCDLLETSVYYKGRDKRGKKYKFCLVCLDGFSKLAYLEPILNKKSATVVEAFKRIFKRNGGIVPTLVQHDMGSEFIGKETRAYFKKIAVEQFSTFSSLKAVLVERFNRTIRNYLARALHANPKSKWTDFVEDFEESYNNTIHSSHGFTPKQASDKKLEGVVWQRLYGKYLFQKPEKPRFAVGDRVRISKSKIIFDKESVESWTREVFVVSKVLRTSPVTYQIVDGEGEPIQGKFYTEELQLTASE